MTKTIIGIHGLSNKPPKDTLADWWKQSLSEGLQENCGWQEPDFNFRMVYWANLLYKEQMHDDEAFSFDALYNSEPYLRAPEGALQEYNESWLDSLWTKVLGTAGSAVDALRQHFGVDTSTAWALGKLLRDLDFYYDETRLIKNRSGQLERASTVLRQDLRTTLMEAHDQEIMLIAHSMGSIIAYDVLRDLGQSQAGVEVSHFVTIGSPLGLPYVKWQIKQQRTYDPKVRTPSIVTRRWINYADKEDKVATDSHLRDDYGPNAHGVRVEDDLVRNDYHGPEGKPNSHKSYGYLRTPELSRHVAVFLEG